MEILDCKSQKKLCTLENVSFMLIVLKKGAVRAIRIQYLNISKDRVLTHFPQATHTGDKCTLTKFLWAMFVFTDFRWGWRDTKIPIIISHNYHLTLFLFLFYSGLSWSLPQLSWMSRRHTMRYVSNKNFVTNRCLYLFSFKVKLMGETCFSLYTGKIGI